MKPAPLTSPSNKRGNWLGKVVEQLKQAYEQNDTETFENLYTETVNALHWKFKESKQLVLPLTTHHSPFTIHITQLRLFKP